MTWLRIGVGLLMEVDGFRNGSRCETPDTPDEYTATHTSIDNTILIVSAKRVRTRLADGFGTWYCDTG